MASFLESSLLVLDQLAGGTAFAGVALLAFVAPFETTSPLVRLPGQSISSLEAFVLVAFLAWGAAIVATRRMPVWQTRLTWPWVAVLAAMLASALLSPVSRTNALHMTGRAAAAFGIYLLAINGLTTRGRVRTVLWVALASGVAVSVLAVLEYLRVPPVLSALRAFRPGLAWVGSQMRAGGPLQYPTIASMYLEVVFAFGLGLLLDEIDRAGDRRRVWRTAAVFLALVLVAEAVALTYTRAGLITVAVSILVVGVWRYRRQGSADAGVRVVGALAAAVAIGVALLRSPQSLFLRFTTESQDLWYRAAIDAPQSVIVDAGSVTTIPMSVTNAGRLTWDSQADPPVLLAYHWIAADSDRVVVWEGMRTPFPAPVDAGQTVTIDAHVSAPPRPGTYRIAWDLVQEHRLWFMTEPGATASRTDAVVRSGAVVAAAPVLAPTSAPPRQNVRPGRLVLWSAAAKMFLAHPLLGVGPDNFRLSYGNYVDLPRADPRLHSNNMYIELAAGGGIVVFAAWLWLVGAAVGCASSLLGRATVRTAAVGAGLAAAMLAIAVHGAVDSFLSFGPTYVLFALTLGSMTAFTLDTESQKSEVRSQNVIAAPMRNGAQVRAREGAPTFAQGYGGSTEARSELSASEGGERGVGVPASEELGFGAEPSESQKSEVRSQKSERDRRAGARCEEVERGAGAPASEEPGYGAEPHLS